MIPTAFPDQTTVLHANPNQTEIDGQSVGELPIFTDGDKVISCWQMTFRERLAALFYGKIWLGIYSGRTQPPVWLSTGKTVFRSEP